MAHLSNFLVWWIRNDECSFINDDSLKDLPKWLRTELKSRQGRNGRGRLWIANEIKFPRNGMFTCPETHLTDELEANYGGIVIRKEDVPLIQDLPGIITDLSWHRYIG